jgi:hypothetical protein
MTMIEDNRHDAYLWDPAAPPSAEVEAIEGCLAPARFEVVRKPLRLTAATSSRVPWFGRRLRFALALSLMFTVIVAGAATFLWWRSNWPAGASWKVAIERPSSGATEPVRTQLRLDEPLHLDATASAQVSIARIGSMHVEPGSAITLVESSSRRHRVMLDRGAVSVRVWAPPGRFSFNTPAGLVLDMGCIFDLKVDEAGVARVQVKTGWVELENGWGETLVPAGASSLMSAAMRPGVPVFDDASAEFSSSVRALEEAGQAADDQVRNGLAQTVIRTARPRDVLTLLMLANASPDPLKRALLERAAQLFPPPSTVTVDAIVDGDKDQLWQWKDTLGLPPVKSWWRNWRDIFPQR